MSRPLWPWEHETATPDALLADVQTLKAAVGPTLDRVGILEQRYNHAFDFLVASSLGYFALRAAHASDVAAGRLLASDPEAERELESWRRLVLRQCSHFGLLPNPTEEAPDAIDIRTSDLRLYRLFGLPADWIPAHVEERRR